MIDKTIKPDKLVELVQEVDRRTPATHLSVNTVGNLAICGDADHEYLGYIDLDTKKVEYLESDE